MCECGACEGECPIASAPAGNIVHEIHITVETDDVQLFKRVCEQHRIKPIIIAFQDELTKGEVTQVMTSHIVNGDDDAAATQAILIAEIFEAVPFKIVRCKVETNLGYERIDGYSQGYFESHLAIEVPACEVNNMIRAAEGFSSSGVRPKQDIRISRNAFKTDGDVATRMITHRRYNISPDQFTQETEEIRKYFVDAGFEVGKTIVEYCWFDSNEKLDDNWRPLRKPA